MNTIRTLTALLIAFLGLAAPTASRAQSPELKVFQMQYNNDLLEKVTEVYNVAVGKLDASYLGGLNSKIAEATAAGDLSGVLSLEAEKKRLADKAALPANDEQAPKSLKNLRSIYRAELAKLEAQRATNQAAVLAPHIAKLKQLEVDLTKATRITDAKAVMDYRQELAAGLPANVSAIAASPTSSQPKSVLPTPLGRDDGVECITESIRRAFRGTNEGIVLQGNSRFSTKQTFTPPVEITIVAKTDRYDLRLAYAADQIIFNWINGPKEFRVDGGPANRMYKKEAGAIPENTFVTIKWIVTPNSQTVFVDGEKRYEHEGDYSKISREVSVFGEKSTVTVKSVKVKKTKLN